MQQRHFPLNLNNAVIDQQIECKVGPQKMLEIACVNSNIENLTGYSSSQSRI